MFTKLLVPLDGSPLAEQAIGQAAAIARASRAEMDLVLVHEPLPFDGVNNAPWTELELVDERAYLESMSAEITSGSSVRVAHAVLEGAVADSICRRAWDEDADLIVMTSHGRTGLSRLWHGSVADGVLRHSAIPVLMLRPIEGKTRERAAHHLFKRLLVLLDGSPLAEDILTSAVALAKCSDAHVTLLQAVQPVPVVTYAAGMAFAYPPVVQDDTATDRLAADATDRLVAIARRLGDNGGVAVDIQVVVADHVAKTILEFARTHDIDAIAMTTHGRGTSRFLMGSVADKVVRGSELSVLLHRPLAVRLADRPVRFTTKKEAAALTDA